MSGVVAEEAVVAVECLDGLDLLVVVVVVESVARRRALPVMTSDE